MSKQTTYSDAKLSGLQNKYGTYETKYNKKTERNEQFFVPASIDKLKEVASAQTGVQITEISNDELVLILTGKAHQVAFENDETEE